MHHVSLSNTVLLTVPRSVVGLAWVACDLHLQESVQLQVGVNCPPTHVGGDIGALIGWTANVARVVNSLKRSLEPVPFYFLA